MSYLHQNYNFRQVIKKGYRPEKYLNNHLKIKNKLFTSSEI